MAFLDAMPILRAGLRDSSEDRPRVRRRTRRTKESAGPDQGENGENDEKSSEGRCDGGRETTKGEKTR